MRTTIDLPDDIHALARQLAHDTNRSIGKVIADLIRLGLQQDRPEPATTERGMPRVSVGRPITSDDVRSLEDE